MTVELSVTIKSGKGYDDSWTVVRGVPSEVKEALVEWYAIDEGTADKLVGQQVMTLATKISHGEQVVSTVLGGVPVEVSTKVSEKAEEPEPAPEEPQGPHPLVAEIEAAGSLEDLKRVYVKNKSSFTEQELKDAYNAKSKELKGK